MTDTFTVARKELRELLGERASRRGVQVQALVLMFLLGIFIPANVPQLWVAGSPYAIALVLMMPAIIAGTIGADSFAGERERKTLDTLLATPLPDHAIVGGKALASLFAATLIVILAMIVATITVNLSAHPAPLFVPAPVLWLGALLGGLACSSISTAIAIALSIRIPVTRSVQQIVSLLFFLPLLFVGVVWRQLGLSVDWPTVLSAEGVGLVAGVLALVVASASFHRERLTRS